MITEINGRFTCRDCGFEWSAMLGDTETPTTCDCEQKEYNNKKTDLKTTTYDDWQSLSQEEKDEFKLGI